MAEDEKKYEPPDIQSVYQVAMHGIFFGKCRLCKQSIKGTIKELREHNCNGKKESNMDADNKLRSIK